MRRVSGIFDKTFVPRYFAQCRSGGTGVLDIRRPAKMTTATPTPGVNRTRRVRAAPPIPVKGVIGSNFPITGDTESFDDEGSLRIGDEMIIAIGPELRIADQKTNSPGDQLWVQDIEVGRFCVTSAIDGDYTITVSTVPYTFAASGNTIEEIRDGLVTAIGAPAGFSVAPSDVDQILIVGTVKGLNLEVGTSPRSLQYVIEKFRDDKYELWTKGKWIDGNFCQYTGRLLRGEGGV